MPGHKRFVHIGKNARGKKKDDGFASLHVSWDEWDGWGRVPGRQHKTRCAETENLLLPSGRVVVVVVVAFACADANRSLRCIRFSILRLHGFLASLSWVLSLLRAMFNSSILMEKRTTSLLSPRLLLHKLLFPFALRISGCKQRGNTDNYMPIAP